MNLQKVYFFIVKIINKVTPLLVTNNTIKFRLLNTFYKVSYSFKGRELLKKEVSNYSKLYKMNSQIVPPYRGYELIGFYVLATEHLLKINFKDYEKIKRVFEFYNDYSVIETIWEGFLKNLYFGENTSMKRFLDSFLGLKFLFGGIHGDLHYSNIMQDDEYNLKVIDLDLSQEHFLRSFDLINIFVSEKILNQNENWKKSFFLTWENQEELIKVFPKWRNLQWNCKKFHFVVYYLMRLKNEKIEISEADEKELISKIINYHEESPPSTIIF